mgnify:CR=1 FL=1
MSSVYNYVFFPHLILETSDDILAKYRKKSILTSTPNSEASQSDRDRRLTLKQADDRIPMYDANNVENCLAFLDAKRKLRIVLGAADFQVNILNRSTDLFWSIMIPVTKLGGGVSLYSTIDLVIQPLPPCNSFLWGGIKESFSPSLCLFKCLVRATSP